jgi:hypothetical protein
MCMMLYVAADRPLPSIEWRKEAPEFYITSLPPAYEAVRRQFTKSFLYFAGAHTGCGCGFQYGLHPVEGEGQWADNLREEEAAGRNSVRRLSEYLSQVVASGEVELYSCWAGQETDQPEERASITPADIGGPVFSFKERQLLIVQQQSS